MTLWIILAIGVVAVTILAIRKRLEILDTIQTVALWVALICIVTYYLVSIPLIIIKCCLFKNTQSKQMKNLEKNLMRLHYDMLLGKNGLANDKLEGG